MFPSHDHDLIFATSASGTAPTEAMRIDSSGNLLVGTTLTNVYNSSSAEGSIISDGNIQVAKSGGVAMYLNRNTSDGSILEFRKSGATVGSIDTKSGDLAIGTGDTGVRFVDGDDALIPHSVTANDYRDDGISLGVSSFRFKDLYLSGGVYLGGTGSANQLDDYEEGTFTPSWQASTTTITVNHASYTKVGRIVTVNFYISNIAPPRS